MTLAIQVTPRTDAWLERKASAAGADKAAVASRVLDQAAEKDLPARPHSPEERLRRFLWVPESVQRDEFRPLRSADDVMAHRYRLFAVENSCRHEGAMFGEQMCSTGYSLTRLIPVKHDGTRYPRR